MQKELGHNFQEEKYTCGPVAAELILKCKSSMSHGTRQNDLLMALDSYGVKTLTFVHAKFEDLFEMTNDGYVAIINYHNFMTGNGHFAVVRSVDAENIILSDPKNGPSFEIEKNKFIENWHNMDKSIFGWVTFVKK